MKPLKGFIVQTIIGADGTQINPGDDIICCSSNGTLNWGTYMGLQDINLGKYVNNKRFWYMKLNNEYNPTKRAYITINNLSRCWNVIKR